MTVIGESTAQQTEVTLDGPQKEYVADLVALRKIAVSLFGESTPLSVVFELRELLGSPSKIEPEVWTETIAVFQTAAVATREAFGAVDPDCFFRVLADLNPDLFSSDEDEAEEEEPEAAAPPKRGRRA